MNFIRYENIVKHTKENNKYSITYLTQLFNYNNDYLKLPSFCYNPLTAICCFIPLPTRLIIGKSYVNENKIVKVNDEYTFMGTAGKRIVFADKILPFISHKHRSPIPFTFPVYDDNHIDILISNVFYYELTVGHVNNMQHWNSNDITVGYGSRSIPYKSHVGYHPNSFGYSLNTGAVTYYNKKKIEPPNSFDHNPICIKLRNSWAPGDTIGAGVIYIDTNVIKPFFTYNGSLIYEFENNILLTEYILPMIGYDFPYSINLNFSNQKFKFDIKSMIDKYSNNIISTNNSFMINQDISFYLNEEAYCPEIYQPNYMSIIY